MSFVYLGGEGGVKPTYFEVYAADKLGPSLRAAVIYSLSVLLFVLVVSADLPFAQCRFCEVEGLKHVIALSTFRSDFSDIYGVRLVNTILAGLTARAIVVIDEHDVIIYTQLVSELANEPDYESVLAAL